MSPRVRIAVVVGALVLAALAMIAAARSMGTREVSIESLISDSIPAGSMITVEGLLDPDSVVWDPSAVMLQFTIVDDQGRAVGIRYSGVRPDGFYAGVSIIVTGEVEVDGRSVAANSIQTRCPSTYEGPKEA